jgi:hypothetical protein
MSLQPGKLNAAANFVNPDCMAKFIEDAMPNPADPEDSGKRGRREFLVALSTGIIEYLKAHDHDSFLVHLPAAISAQTGTLEIK